MLENSEIIAFINKVENAQYPLPQTDEEGYRIYLNREAIFLHGFKIKLSDALNKHAQHINFGELPISWQMLYTWIGLIAPGVPCYHPDDIYSYIEKTYKYIYSGDYTYSRYTYNHAFISYAFGNMTAAGYGCSSNPALACNYYLNTIILCYSATPPLDILPHAIASIEKLVEERSRAEASAALVKAKNIPLYLNLAAQLLALINKIKRNVPDLDLKPAEDFYAHIVEHDISFRFSHPKNVEIRQQLLSIYSDTKRLPDIILMLIGYFIYGQQANKEDTEIMLACYTEIIRRKSSHAVMAHQYLGHYYSARREYNMAVDHYCCANVLYETTKQNSSENIYLTLIHEITSKKSAYSGHNIKTQMQLIKLAIMAFIHRYPFGYADAASKANIRSVFKLNQIDRYFLYLCTSLNYLDKIPLLSALCEEFFNEIFLCHRPIWKILLLKEFLTNTIRTLHPNEYTNEIKQFNDFTTDIYIYENKMQTRKTYPTYTSHALDSIKQYYNKEISPVDEAGPGPGFRPLHIAVLTGDVALVSQLCERKATMTAESKENETPLQLLLNQPHINLRLACMLFYYGAQKGTKNCDGDTLLHIAVKNNWPEAAVALLLRAGLDPNMLNDQGFTSLQILSNQPHINLRLACLLLQYCASKNSQNRDGDTLLHIAAKNKLPKAEIELLIKAGIDPNILNTRGLTPLQFLLNNGSENTYEYILMWIKLGANPNVKDKNGRTLLHRLALQRNTKLIEALQALPQVDLTICDNEGMTAGQLLLMPQETQETVTPQESNFWTSISSVFWSTSITDAPKLSTPLITKETQTKVAPQSPPSSVGDYSDTAKTKVASSNTSENLASDLFHHLPSPIRFFGNLLNSLDSPQRIPLQNAGSGMLVARNSLPHQTLPDPHRLAPPQLKPSESVEESEEEQQQRKADAARLAQLEKQSDAERLAKAEQPSKTKDSREDSAQKVKSPSAA